MATFLNTPSSSGLVRARWHQLERRVPVCFSLWKHAKRSWGGKVSEHEREMCWSAGVTVLYTSAALYMRLHVRCVCQADKHTCHMVHCRHVNFGRGLEGHLSHTHTPKSTQKHSVQFLLMTQLVCPLFSQPFVFTVTCPPTPRVVVVATRHIESYAKNSLLVSRIGGLRTNFHRL